MLPAAPLARYAQTKARTLAASHPDPGSERIIVGLAGAPGAGKSSIAQAVIDHLGKRARKGAIDTFDAPWGQVVTLLDEGWFVQLDAEERVRRLRKRHEQFGKSPEAARDWVAEIDEPNARLIETTAHRAMGAVQAPA